MIIMLVQKLGIILSKKVQRGQLNIAIFITLFVFGILYLLHIFDYDVIKFANKHKKKSI